MGQYGNTSLQERIARRKKRERQKFMRKGLVWLVLLAAIAVVAAAIWGAVAFVASLRVEPMEFEFSETVSAYAAIEPIVEYNKNYGIGMRYPETKDKELDEVIKTDAIALADALEAEISEYQAQDAMSRASIKLDFDAYEQGNALSVIYKISKVTPESSEERIATYLYDTENKKAVSANQIFSEKYLEIASDYLKRSIESDEQMQVDGDKIEAALAPEWDNFDSITFEDEENLTLYFAAGKLLDNTAMLKLPLKRVFDTMQINLTGYEPPKVIVDPAKPMVALTFDDGPSAANTTRVLDALEAVGGRATFFVIGENIPGNEEVMKRAYELGCEIGNHSFNHKNLAKLDAAGITDQISKTNELVKGAIGEPTALVRAPYGEVNDAVRANVGAPIIAWSIDTLDWQSRDPDKIVPKILENVQDGSIILMHDIYKTSAAAAETVIPKLVAQGYQLVTVSELMEAREVSMANGKIYYYAYK